MFKQIIGKIGLFLLDLGASLAIKYFDIDGDGAIEPEEIKQRVSENTQKLVDYINKKKKKN